MKKLITILLLLIIIPTVTYAGWWSDLFGKKTLNNTTSQKNVNQQKNVNTNTTTTTIGDTQNTVLGDTNTVNIPDENKSYILNFKDLDTIFGEKLLDANKTASQGVLYLGKSNEIINRASNDNVKQSKENTDVISKNLTEIKEIQGGILKLGTDYPGIQTTVNLPTQTQTLLETLNANIVTPLVNLGAKIESLTNQSLSNNNALISAINNMSSIPSSGGSGTNFVSSAITQTLHGLVAFNWVYLTTGGLYTKAINTNSATSETIGMVTTVTDANTIKITFDGYVTGMSGLTIGTRYYLSGTTAGAMTITVPTTGIVRPIFIADTATSGYIQQYTSGESLPGTIAQVFATSIVTPSAAQTTAGTSVLIPGMTTTLTPNGTTRYLVMTSVRARTVTTASNNSVDGGIQAALFDSAAPTVAIANSEVLPVYNINQNTISVNSVTQQIQATSGSSYVLTISSPMTLQVRAWNVSAATTGTVMADNNGRTSMTIIQLDNKLPVSGQRVDYVMVKNKVTTASVANQSFFKPDTVVSGNIPYNATTGLFSLTAGNTYELVADLAMGGGQSGIEYAWKDTVTGLQFGSQGVSVLDNGVASTYSVLARAIYTPSVNTTVGVVNLFNTAFPLIGSTDTTSTGVTGLSQPSMTITQLGSSATTTTTRVNVICRNKTAQSLPSGAWTVLTNWTEVQDPTNSFNPVTGVFTAPRTASYQFSAGNATQALATGNYFGQSLYLNGTTQLYNFLVTAGGPVVHYPQTSGTIEITEGQTLQTRTYNGGATGNDSPSASNSWFTITEINPNY